MRRDDATSHEEPGRPSRRRLLCVAAGCIATATACFLAGLQPVSAHAAGDVTIAVVASPDAPSAPDGGSPTAAVREAAEAINRDGGVLGNRLRVLALADDCSAQSGAAVAERIVSEGAALVVGHVCSSSAVAAAAVYARHSVIMITPGARAPRLTEARAGPNIFRLAGRDDRFGAEAAAFIAARMAGKRIALVHDKSLEARTLADAADRALLQQGIKPVLREAYVAGEREYHAIAARLVAAAADVLVMPAQPIEARVLSQRWRLSNPAGLLIGSALLAVPEIEPYAAATGDRLIVLLPADTRGVNAGGRPASPSPLAVRSRAAVEAWARAVRTAGSVLARPVAETLAAGPMPTSAGPVTFDRNGDADVPSFIPHSWRDGDWRPLPPG